MGPMSRSSPWRAGDLLASSYRVVRLLGQGSKGAVYLATEPSGKEVLLKAITAELTSDPGVSRRLAQAARLGMYLGSERVLRVLATGVEDRSGLPFVVTELAHGPTLGARLASEQPLPREEASQVVRGLLEALVAAHTIHVVHGDLQPESVLLVPGDDGAPNVKVQDFGLSLRTFAGTSEQGVATAGLNPWTAPECASPNEAPSAASDVWSAGLIAFEAFTGKSYWKSVSLTKASVFEVMVEVLRSPIVPASKRAAEYGRAHCLPPGFDAWFARCVSRDPSVRYRDGRLARGAFTSMRAPTGFVWDRRTRLMVGAMAGLLLLAGTVFALTR